MMKDERLILLDGPVNFRDLGGYVNQKGQIIKWHKVYRSDSLSNLSIQDQQKLTDLKITVDCDLRSQMERQVSPDIPWPNCTRIDLPLYDEESDETESHFSLRNLWHKIPVIDDYLGSIYQRVLLNKHSQKMIQELFEQLLALPEQEALVYHCSAGKDRTGIVTAVFLLALGVKEETIVQDYLLTNRLYDFAWQKEQPTADDLQKMISQMNTTRGEGMAIQAIAKTITAGWGSVNCFLAKELHFSSTDLDDLQQLYLEAKNDN